MPKGTNPAAAPNGSTCSYSRILPPRTSPTSNATYPRGRVILNSSRKVLPIALHRSARDRVTVGPRSTTAASIPQNQHRNQLSFAYWTVSRKGGEVTVRLTDSSGIGGAVNPESPVRKRSLFPALFSLVRSSGVRSLTSDRVFLRIRSRIFRYSGTYPRDSWRFSGLINLTSPEDG